MDLMSRTPQQWGQSSHRTCDHCLQVFALNAENFAINSRRRPWNASYFMPWCRSCGTERSRLWKQLNRERRNATERLGYQRRKQQAAQHVADCRSIGIGNVASEAGKARLATLLAPGKARQAALDKKAFIRAAMRHIHQTSPTYQPPKLMFGRWKGLTSAQRIAILKAEQGSEAAEHHQPDAEERDHMAAMLLLIETNRVKFAEQRPTPGPRKLPFGGSDTPP